MGNSTWPRIPIARPDIGELELANLRTAMASGWITQGKFVAEAEQRLGEITGRSFVICVSSGTMALVVSLMALDLPPNSIVLVPSFGFAAISNAVKLTGHWPMYAWTSPLTWQSEYDRHRQSAQANCIITAPCYGKTESCDLVTDHIPVIHDAAESFGGKWNGLSAAKYGLIACVSFYANKICTAGEGGAVLTDDPILAKRIRLIVNHGIDNREYRSVVPGLNGRMTDLQAAVLCAQLMAMPYMLKRRNQIMNKYLTAAQGLWRVPQIREWEEPAPWLFAGIPRDKSLIQNYCEQRNIECRPFFHIPENRMVGPEIRKVSENGLCLPLSSAMKDEEVDRVCEVIANG